MELTGIGKRWPRKVGGNIFRALTPARRRPVGPTSLRGGDLSFGRGRTGGSFRRRDLELVGLATGFIIQFFEERIGEVPKKFRRIEAGAFDALERE